MKKAKNDYPAYRNLAVGKIAAQNKVGKGIKSTKTVGGDLRTKAGR